MRAVGLMCLVGSLLGCSPSGGRDIAEEGVSAKPATRPQATGLPGSPVPPPGANDSPPARDALAARSEYTSLNADDCRLENRDAETGAVRFRCAGVGGFDLRVHDSDARMSLDVLARQGAAARPLELWGVAAGAFSQLGERAEWRFPPGASAPAALIVRFDVFEQPDRPERPSSRLLVVKLGAADSCLVAQVPPGDGQNVAARRLADRASSMPCLEFAR
jgi:hypothetical protein